MATIENRSPFTITVAKHPELTKTFAYKRKRDALDYLTSLGAAGHDPDITQAAEAFQVRVRHLGRKAQILTFRTLAEAEAFVTQLDADRTRKIFRDYSEAAKTTTADLIRRYIEEDCPGLKGGANYTIILRAMLADSTHELRRLIEQRKQEAKEYGAPRTPLKANREPMTSLEWLNRPLTEVKPTDIEDFIADRLEDVSASTVDRQLDLLSAIYNRAINSWRIHLDLSPMAGVKRPKFFNERDRRLTDDEELRLLQAARKEDRINSLEAHVANLAAADIALAKTLPTHYAVNEARKEALRKARERAMTEGFPHIPMMEAFVMFQLATAARRGEAMGLFWNQVNWEKQTARMPTSKNGRPRTLLIRSDILELLKALPRSSDLVFDMSLKELANAWKRMCEDAGIEDFRIHDMRHEGISRAAESGLFNTILDLQAFSGHREYRSLARYTHLCKGAITKKLEEGEAQRQASLGNKGYRRLKASDVIWMGEYQPDSPIPTAPTKSLNESQSSNVITVANWRSRSAV